MSYDRKLAAEAEKRRAHLPTVCEVIDTLSKNDYEAQEEQVQQREGALMQWTESKLPWTPERENAFRAAIYPYSLEFDTRREELLDNGELATGFAHYAAFYGNGTALRILLEEGAPETNEHGTVWENCPLPKTVTQENLDCWRMWFERLNEMGELDMDLEAELAATSGSSIDQAKQFLHQLET